MPVSAEIVEACREAQREVAYTVLCPARLPRPTAAGAPAPLDVGVYEGGRTIDLGYGAAYEHPQIDALNTPARFLHFVVGKAIHGVPADARLATLGGRRGLLAPASGPYFQGAYYGNHVRFVWRERGTRYVATLHTFGNRVPERCSIGSCAP